MKRWQTSPGGIEYIQLLKNDPPEDGYENVVIREYAKPRHGIVANHNIVVKLIEDAKKLAEEWNQRAGFDKYVLVESARTGQPIIPRSHRRRFRQG